MITAEVFKAAIQQKTELMEKIAEQMKPDIENNILEPETINLFNVSRTSFAAALQNISKPEDALYLFGRGCTNYGQFIAFKNRDKGITE